LDATAVALARTAAAVLIPGWAEAVLRRASPLEKAVQYLARIHRSTS